MSIANQIAYAERKKKALVQSAPAAGKPPPPRPPVSVAAASREPGGEMTFLVKAPKALVAQLEAARARLGLRSRNDAVIALLKKALGARRTSASSSGPRVLSGLP